MSKSKKKNKIFVVLCSLQITSYPFFFKTIYLSLKFLLIWKTKEQTLSMASFHIKVRKLLSQRKFCTGVIRALQGLRPELFKNSCFPKNLF